MICTAAIFLEHYKEFHGIENDMALDCSLVLWKCKVLLTVGCMHVLHIHNSESIWFGQVVWSIRALFVCCITWSSVLCQLFWTSSPAVVCHCLCCWFVPLDPSFWAELTLLKASCRDGSCYSYSQAFSCIYFRLNNHYVTLPLLSLGFAFSLVMYVTITIVGHLSAFRYFQFALVHIHIQCQE
jgi:hypothetical protein